VPARSRVISHERDYGRTGTQSQKGWRLHRDTWIFSDPRRERSRPSPDRELVAPLISRVRFRGGPHGPRLGSTIYTVVESGPFSLANASKRSSDFSQEGGKRVPTAEFCLPPSGAKSHYSGMQRQRLYFVTSRSKPRPTKLGLMYFFIDISFWQSLIGSVLRTYYSKTRSVRETMVPSHPVGNPLRQPPAVGWQLRCHF
jgi:hypothetical protein